MRLTRSRIRLGVVLSFLDILHFKSYRNLNRNFVSTTKIGTKVLNYKIVRKEIPDITKVASYQQCKNKFTIETRLNIILFRIAKDYLVKIQSKMRKMRKFFRFWRVLF
jgi:hypothetical protein